MSDELCACRVRSGFPIALGKYKEVRWDFVRQASIFFFI